MGKNLKMWNTVDGKMRIFANEKEYKKNGKKQKFTAYTTSLSIKGEDDKYINYYLSVTFKKDEAPEMSEDYIDINLKSGFITFDTNNDKKYLRIVVTDYETLE